MKKFLYLPIALIMTLISSCGKDGYHSLEGAVWGTFYHISYQSEENLDDSIMDVMHSVNMSMSPFEKASVISRINHNECDSVDAMMAEVMRLSQHICSISGGCFDPTVGPLVNIWGFGHKTGLHEPDSATIDSILQSVGMMQCQLIDDDQRIVKKSPATEFDFSAIAKGYGVDQIANMLRRNGVENFMVEIGGEIVVSGLNSKGQKWRIQVDAPIEAKAGEFKHERLDVLHVTDCAVATSGNYRNYRNTADGKKIGHTISPIDGYPYLSATLSATVIAPDCATADALATAAMAMPDSAAVAMLEAYPGVEAILVVQAEGVAYRVVRVPDEK